MLIMNESFTRIDQEVLANNGTVVLYTVPAGYSLFLSESMLHASIIGIGYGSLVIRDTLDATVRTINQLGVASAIAAVISDHNHYPDYIEVPAGYDVAVVSSAAPLTVIGGISGLLTVE